MEYEGCRLLSKKYVFTVNAADETSLYTSAESEFGVRPYFGKCVGASCIHQESLNI